MEYYRIDTIFKNYKQLTALCEKLDDSYNLLGDNSIRKIGFNKEIDFEIELPILVINPKIIGPTDVINVIPITYKFFVCSQQTNDTLNTMKLARNQTCKVLLKYIKQFTIIQQYFFPLVLMNLVLIFQNHVLHSIVKIGHGKRR